jgi:hypothetical protein
MADHAHQAGGVTEYQVHNVWFEETTCTVEGCTATGNRQKGGTAWTWSS